MSWIKKVFELIRNTEVRGIISGGLHEIWIDCEDKIELLENQPALIDNQDEKVYFDDKSTGNTMALKKRRNFG